ncbi:uncharacterized protein LOC114716675 isoform X1 [Neltuma alba]|uniref:uncharacterized protein LOC114716675 isoform X1 n=1 Tax=Neltuma alba TaxID=207710 RepID=UPI0010A4A0C7|nr:uncharacterized protein LOC114716675 isoform X1 [Prosopis alba]
MASSGSFSRQVNGKEAWKSTSKRWSGKNKHGRGSGGMSVEASLNQMCGNEGNKTAARKRVMVVVDHSSHSKHALIWAITHVANKADLLTLLHVVPPHTPSHSSSSTYLLNYLLSLCKDCRPEAEVEALVIEGPKLSTVTSQVKKLEVSVLVLGQKKPSLLFNWLDFSPAFDLSLNMVFSLISNCVCVNDCAFDIPFSFADSLCGSSSAEEFVEHCIHNVECLTIGVRKRSQGTNGYLISTKWQKNFWLLA